MATGDSFFATAGAVGADTAELPIPPNPNPAPPPPEAEATFLAGAGAGAGARAGACLVVTAGFVSSSTLFAFPGAVDPPTPSAPNKPPPRANRPSEAEEASVAAGTLVVTLVGLFLTVDLAAIGLAASAVPFPPKRPPEADDATGAFFAVGGTALDTSCFFLPSGPACLSFSLPKLRLTAG